ncbi:cytochrome c peroxidase [Beggiatoa alba B18LD]|uniref:Cytochrome c peroxidase n=1 Tax=Beggiatoa alba B18LD TaxID=395493 RepID=I3CL15_9GAMM|nr:cytochrome c peroxidase [Beggiatoa alba]EIJ44308.1 cytochrome c peroxidase [Beggiatoa alba B18LD]
MQVGKLIRQIFWLLLSFLPLAIWMSLWLSQSNTDKVTSKPLNKPNVQAYINEPIQPLPEQLTLNLDKVRLGQQLFYDPRLSKNNKMACVSCHALTAEDKPYKSTEFNGTNIPTLYNIGFNVFFNWDGRTEQLGDEIDNSIHAPDKLATDWQSLATELQQYIDYAEAFKRVYPNARLNEVTIKEALTHFLKSIYTPNARFDKFLRGDLQALTDKEMEGYQLFKQVGCVGCHQGINIGGNLLQKMGLTSDYFAERDYRVLDNGRFNLTGQDVDRYVFRVPSLRNIANTAPYLHDGSVNNLADVVAIMARYQLGRPLTNEQIKLIVSFLQTLTGEYQGKPL